MIFIGSKITFCNMGSPLTPLLISHQQNLHPLSGRVNGKIISFLMIFNQKNHAQFLFVLVKNTMPRFNRVDIPKHSGFSCLMILYCLSVLPKIPTLSRMPCYFHFLLCWHSRTAHILIPNLTNSEISEISELSRSEKQFVIYTTFSQYNEGCLWRVCNYQRKYWPFRILHTKHSSPDH